MRRRPFATARRARLSGVLGLGLVALLAVTPALVGAPAAHAAPTPAPSADSADSQEKAPVDPEKLQTFGIGPANADGVDRRPAFVYAGRPGTVINDRFALLNFTFKPLKVKVYASDAFTSDTGAFDVLPEADKPTDLGSWTNLKPKVVTIPARSSEPGAAPAELVLPFRLTVPKKASPGDHAGGIVVSTNTKEVSGGNTAGIVVDRRVGTRVYLRVAGAIEPKLEVKDLRISYVNNWNPIGKGSARVSYRVENTGNVVLSAKQRLRVDGWLGTSASTPMADLIQVLPGDDVLIDTVVEGVWPTFRVNAVVELDPYAEATDTKQFAPVVASTSTWAIPWTLIALIVAIALLTWRISRRLRNRTEGEPTTSPIDDNAEAVLVP